MGPAFFPVLNGFVRVDPHERLLKLGDFIVNALYLVFDALGVALDVLSRRVLALLANAALAASEGLVLTLQTIEVVVREPCSHLHV